jgi:hypothetical protein
MSHTPIDEPHHYHIQPKGYKKQLRPTGKQFRYQQKETPRYEMNENTKERILGHQKYRQLGDVYAPNNRYHFLLYSEGIASMMAVAIAIVALVLVIYYR